MIFAPMKLRILTHPEFILLSVLIYFAYETTGNNMGIFFGQCLYAQTPKYPYRKYQDRKEGIVSKRQLASGEKLDLISAYIENNEVEPEGRVSKFNLAFYLPDTCRVKTTVFEVENSYMMEPLQVEYLSGLYQFSWPSEIPQYYKIKIKDLHPLAIVLGTGGKRIVPVVLSYAMPKLPILSYCFCFVPRQKLSNLQYKVYQSQSYEPIFFETLRELGSQIYIRWNGKDRSNRAVSDGFYYLVLEATFNSSPGTAPKTVKSAYLFYHYAEIIKGNWVGK